MLNRKGQGTIEYLVIIAIVVVIALVVVGLLLQVMGNSGGASESSVRAAWKSQTPWAITDWSMTGTDGNISIVLRNNTAETLQFNRIMVVDANSVAGYAGNVAPGASKVVSVDTTAGAVGAGAKYAFPKANIYIDYNTTNIAGVKQYANSDIVGTAQ